MEAIIKNTNTKSYRFKDFFNKEILSESYTIRMNELINQEFGKIHGSITDDQIELVVSPKDYPSVTQFIIDLDELTSDMQDRSRLSISMKPVMSQAIVTLLETQNIHFSTTDYGSQTPFIKLSKCTISLALNFANNGLMYLNLFKLQDHDIQDVPQDELSHIADII